MKKTFIILFTALLILTTGLCACGTHKHELTKTERQDATCTTDGNLEYWQCKGCGKKFADKQGTQEITDVVIPASHQYGKYSYNYETKSYNKTCSKCHDIQSVTAGSAEYPLLARNETELAEVVSSADENSFIKLANDITITTGTYEVVLRLPNNGTLDLGGYTVTVKNNGGFVVEGTNVTLQNGKVVTDFAAPASGYAVFIGDEGDNNAVTVKNLETEGGLNVYNCTATVSDCKVDASQHKYYALWADSHSTITIESGTYYGGEIACVHSTTNADPEGDGNIIINGGEYHGKIMATRCTAINGGTFDNDIILTVHNNCHAKLIVNKAVHSSLNIILDGSAKYEMVYTADEDGNFVYETKTKEQTV